VARILRGSSRTILSRSNRRKTAWELGPGDSAAQTPLSATASSLTSGVSFLVDGGTVVRLRGHLVLQLTTAAALADGFHGAFGIGVATLAAFTAGVASVPTPITELAWDGWLYHQFVSIKAGDSVIAAGASNEPGQMHSVSAVQRVDVDSRAMRKVNIDEVVYACLEVGEVGTASMAWFFNSRLLLKLA